MTAAQVAILRSFVTGTIGDRALSFTFPDPEGGAALWSDCAHLQRKRLSAFFGG